MSHKYIIHKFASLVMMGSILLSACSPLSRVIVSSTGSAPTPVEETSGPTTSPEVVPGRGSLDTITIASLLDVLKSAGVLADLVQKGDSTLLDSQESWTVTTGSGELFVYVFSSPEEALAASQRIGPDGTEITGVDGSVSSVRWIGSPHFWLYQSFIVQYLGDDTTILSGLEQALGKQFAGMSQSAGQPETKSPWKEVRIESNRIGFAVPCWWQIGEMPGEGVLRSLSIRSYDDAFFLANSEKGEWKNALTPDGAYKVDITLAAVDKPALSTEEAYKAYMDPTMSEIVASTEIKIGSNNWTVLTLKNLVNTEDKPGDVYVYRLAQNQLMILSAYPWPSAIDSRDVQAILGSFAFSSEQAVPPPLDEPHAPLIEASCAQ